MVEETVRSALSKLARGIWGSKDQVPPHSCALACSRAVSPRASQSELFNAGLHSPVPGQALERLFPGQQQRALLELDAKAKLFGKAAHLTKSLDCLAGSTSVQDRTMGRCGIVAAVLLLLSFEKTRAVLAPCAHCPPGTHTLPGQAMPSSVCPGARGSDLGLPGGAPGTFCEANKNQTCTACPANSFSKTGGERTCKICKDCVEPFRTKKPCSSTSNTECECIPGLRCVEPDCNMCQLDCQPGQGAAGGGPCAPVIQKPSQDCGSGTFKEPTRGTCQPWTDCALDGKSVRVNGTKDSDVVCGPPLPGVSPGHTPGVMIGLLALVSTLALVLLVLFALQFSVMKHSRKKLLDMVKQPFMKPVQVAQEEDGCSCRFPEEEEYEI
ncbi:Tumor necrosis factor receptor superfamily member 9 [Galemys pyrenaicus]|uniref:Tumor necrosis factor receptor superfamily member 9 n=1 Tax=Galemys pyrenaicus TaxID=202257 RepID=A0A8J6DEF0_GALPY|nr:Tumor necrosis factor receptor superfamily member 9 [Galemys pyrenaicus]